MQVLEISSHQLHALATYNQDRIAKYPMNRRLGEIYMYMTQLC